MEAGEKLTRNGASRMVLGFHARKNMKTESEVRAKLAEMLAVDGHDMNGRMIYSKAAACKTLLWALGENDDDRWYITSTPGPPVDRRGIARN